MEHLRSARKDECVSRACVEGYACPGTELDWTGEPGAAHRFHVVMHCRIYSMAAK